MFRSFSDEAGIASSTPDRPEEPNRRFNKMILIGTLEWVRGMISRLHMAGIAEVGAPGHGCCRLVIREK